MKTKLTLFVASILLMMFASVELFAGPPTPPAGWKWVRVDALTDEFEDGTVNTNKWHKTNPYWVGRDPGRFKEYCVTESNGKLHLKNYYLHPTTQQVWVHTGFVASKNKTAFYKGYYSECKIRGSQDGTVFGFWMSKPGSKQEIDVQEGVAFSGKRKYRYLGNYMRMNTHTPSGQVAPQNHNTGWSVGHGFHTYGVWWKGPQHIVMYYGGGNGKAFNHYPKQAFTGGMQLNINSECQNWLGNPLPHRLNDNRYNYTSVEYVRTWKLVPINSRVGQSAVLKSTKINNTLDKEIELKVFPNPATDILNLSGLQSGSYSALILNIEGKIVKQKVIQTDSDLSSISLANLANGIYILKLSNDEMTKTIRFVKE